MARIIHHGDVYQEISLKMFHESEVQGALAARAHLVFPGYKYTLFYALVSYEDDSGKPDFALVENEYRHWYIGEVEMVRHDLIGHVMRQVRIFTYGEYNEDHYQHIIRQKQNFNMERLKLLIETVSPTVLVVADKMDDAWKHAIHSEGAKMAVFEMFRREKSADLIFRVNGDLPEIPSEFISYCDFDRSFPRLLRIKTPAGIPAVNGEYLVVEYEGIISEWVYMVADDKAWLNPVGHLELPRDFRYKLSLGPNNKLKLEAKYYASNRRS